MSFERDYGYSHHLALPELPLPPESRKGWLIFLAAAAVLIFGITAFGTLASGLTSFYRRENLNSALELESQIRGSLLSLRRIQASEAESSFVPGWKEAFRAHSENLHRLQTEFARALTPDNQYLPLLADVDSAVDGYLVQGRMLLQVDEKLNGKSESKTAGESTSKLKNLKGRTLTETHRSFLKAGEGLQKIEARLQSGRKELAAFQLVLFKRLYVVSVVSILFGIIVVWLLVQARASQRREGGISDSLARTVAEIKAAEEALRQANERFHLAASATSGVIYDWDISAGRIVWTENISSVFGYAIEEVEPRPIWWEKQIHPADRERIGAQLKENLASRRDFIGEYRFRHKEGHYVDVWDKGRVMFDASGKAIRMVGSMVDVSEQKRVEKALRAVAAGISSATGVNFFRSLVRHLATALGVKYTFVAELLEGQSEHARTIAVWSGQGYEENFEYELAGTPCENVVGKKLEFYGSQVQKQFPNDQILKDMQAESYMGTPLLDSAGQPLGVLAVLDIQPLADEFGQRSILALFAARAAAELERKRTEEALRRSEERFRSIFENASAGMVTVGPDGHYLQVNPAFCRWLGYSEDELIKMNALDVTHPDDFERTRAILREVVSGKRAVMELDKRYVRKDGQVVWGHISSAWLFDAEGRPLYGVSLIQDVSERKRAVEELARARDAALEQAGLKSQFLANMSHEIRTPMNGVLGYLGLLASGAYGDEREMTEFVRGAKTSAESLLTLINDILDFSKIEAGKLSIESIEFDLRSVVEDTASLLAPKAEQKGLELACLVEFGVPLALKGDPTRLRQILINLAGNAAKFTEKGEIVIRASLLEENDQTARIRFSVKDTGVGIPQEKHHLLFQSFTQVDGSSTRRFGGTGLGLAISKQLVELMGGVIGFESEPGAGSEFWFEVPLSKNLAARQRVVNADIRNAVILIVDDNVINRDILCRMVESFGCRPFSAGAAAEAVKILQMQLTMGDPIQVAIIDFQMPEENGEQLARRIKANPALAGTALVLLTSMGSRGDAVRAKEAGFAAYLNKPVKQSQLLEAIMAVVGRQKTGEAEDQPLITRRWLEEAKWGGAILVAEDNQVNQAVAEAVLSRAGYTVVCVKDGSEALEVLAERDFDLVLMDLQMPEMDGVETTRAIRQWKGKKARIPILAMTAHALSGDKEKCLKAGMNDYVSKPIEPSELLSVVERWLERQRDPGSTPEETVPPGAAASMDFGRLTQSAGGDRGFERRLIELFLSDSPKRLNRVQALAADGKFSELEREAHSLKGASANLGAAVFSKTAAELEEKARLELKDACRTLARRLFREFERVRQALKKAKLEWV